MNCRHRPALGECLGAFASCFPVAFLEPHLNKYNKNSILYGLEGKISEHSLEAQGQYCYLQLLFSSISFPSVNHRCGYIGRVCAQCAEVLGFASWPRHMKGVKKIGIICFLAWSLAWWGQNFGSFKKKDLKPRFCASH